MLDIFKSRLCCTHIHDNFSRLPDEKEGDFDLHLLPFDGTYDYENMMRRLDKYSYSGTLMLEVFTTRKEEYGKMSPEEFIKLAYSRAKRIAEL